MVFTVVKPNRYMDSIFLMKATRQVLQIGGVQDAVLVMGSEMNKTILADFGGLTDEAQAAGTNDLIVSVDAAEGMDGQALSRQILSLLDGGQEQTGAKAAPAGETAPESIQQALEACPETNLALISLPGEYAGLEAKRALRRGLHVFIFSDLPEEEELELKKEGLERDLLVMGPGAGTAVIDGVSIGLMSKVRRGSVGIAAASGSGLQEVAVLVHRKGLGISQAIGVGGRDLSQAVGGSMMLRAIGLLEDDPDTSVIVLVSKPPHPATCEKIYARIGRCRKPVVVFFLGGDNAAIRAAGGHAAGTLEQAAELACALAEGCPAPAEDSAGGERRRLAAAAAEQRARLAPGQKYLRGLFCGGTHAEEAVVLLRDLVPDLHANIAFGGAQPLDDRFVSQGNSLVDMGDEQFTRGRPHPVIDPSILCDRLAQEGADPQTAVILFDVILGCGVHDDPVGCLEMTLADIQAASRAAGRHIVMAASVCGTDLDPQDMRGQIGRLEKLGVIVLNSNSQAALLAGLIVGGGN